MAQYVGKVPAVLPQPFSWGLLPFYQTGTAEEDVHIHAITGSTGAYQQPTTTSHFSWRNNNMSIYKAFQHQHLAESRAKLGNCRKV